MQIQLTGRHVEITDPIREYVNKKFEKLERHFDHITQVHAILDVQKERHIAEGKLNVTGGEIFAESHEENLYAAIDTLIDKLDRQLIKHKNKVQNHHAERPKYKEED